MRKKRYHIIFAVIMSVLLLPLVQEVFDFKCWPLEGYVEPLEPVAFHSNTYRDFSFQDYCKKKAVQKLGFKSLFVRAYNQVLHSCFHESSNNTLVRGKHGHYYLKQYTDDVTGVTLQQKYGSIDSAKSAALRNVLSTLRLIDSLKQHNTQLLIVLAPSKTAIYPEYLPDSMQQKISHFSLQEYYGELFKKTGIPYLDFVSLFRKIKSTAPYPLYTKYGTHWNASTIPFVGDTLLQRIAKISKTRLPHLQYLDSNISKRYTLKGDYELESTANLLFRMKREKLPNPTYRLSGVDGCQKPKLLVIADSYYTQLQGTCFEDAFEVVDYWKYNQQAFSTLPGRTGDVALLDRYKTITEADVIVVMFTSMFAYDYLFGFADMALKVLADGSNYDLEAAIQNVIRRIKSDPKWYESVKKQAKERKISLDKSLRDNAIYVLENE